MKLTLNGMSLRSGDPTLKLDHPWTAHPSIQITASAAGDLKWVYLPLPLLQGNAIKNITLYYHNSNAASYISQTRLVDQTSPDQAFVKHDDGTDLRSIVATSYTSNVGNLVVAGSTVLMFRLFFANNVDVIRIGAIIVEYQ